MNTIFNKIITLQKLIGNTPLAEISIKYKDHPLKIYSKIEHYNFTGSIKDRIALYMINNAYLNNQIHEKDIIVEATSGNTGISFAALGTYLGHKVKIFMPDWLSIERKKLLESYNAELILVSKDEGGFIECVKRSKEYSKKHQNVFLPCQFCNEDNMLAHYFSTAPEIYNSLQKIGLEPTLFVAGVGTGGTVMGINKYLKEKNRNVKSYALEPLNSRTLSTGKHTGSHRIQGISDEFIPDILDLNSLSGIIGVDDGDSIIMSQLICKKFGLGIGISSGANFLGAIKALEMNNYQGTVVTVFADDNKKYVSTDLMNNEPVKENFISTDVELIDINII